MQTDAEVAAIAAGLTKAQREAMVRNYTHAELRALDKGDPSTTTLNCLRHKGLVDGHLWSREGRYTSLGLRVAQHLKQENAK